MRSIRFLAAVVLCAVGLLAQDAQDKQEQARQRFLVLSRRMQELQVILSTTAPEESRVLKLGNRHLHETRVQEDLEGIGALIEGERWDEALERMEEVKRELEDLLALLQNKDVDLEKLLEEIERLTQFRDRVDKLIGEQARERQAAAEAEALEQRLRELEAAKAKVNELLAAQTKLRDSTREAGLAVGAKAAQMAEQEGELKKQAEELAARLGELGKDDSPAGEKDGEAGKAEPKDGEQADQEAGKHADQGKPGEPAGAPKDGKDGGEAGKGGSCGQCAGSCQSAAQAMGQAQQKLQADKPESSLEDQDKAIAKLQEALGELDELSEEARRRLLQIPFEQQVKAQEQTRVATDKLAEDMQASEQGENGKPTPGKKNVQQSVPKQKAAAGQLKERKPGKAKQDQQDAQDELEQAKKELEDALAQLRQEMQDQVLRALEERLAAMLAKQRELSALTKVTDRLKGEALTANDAVPASIQERCGKEAKGETALASEAHDAIKLLEEDGTTAVYPELFGELERDLTTVADRLTGCDTGVATQEMQRQIEELMAMLLDSLRKQIEEGGGH